MRAVYPGKVARVQEVELYRVQAVAIVPLLNRPAVRHPHLVLVKIRLCKTSKLLSHMPRSYSLCVCTDKMRQTPLAFRSPGRPLSFLATDLRGPGKASAPARQPGAGLGSVVWLRSSACQRRVLLGPRSIDIQVCVVKGRMTSSWQLGVQLFGSMFLPWQFGRSKPNMPVDDALF